MSAESIAIVTDSTNDLPLELRQQYNIHVVPLYILWGKEQLREGIDISAEAFYQRLASDPVLPSTSQPTPQDFTRVYREIQEQGAREIVTLTLSGAMSGTLQSARQASQAVDIPVHVYDSKSNSMSLGWQVMAAARMREAGHTATEMLAAADAVRKKLVYIISLNTLDYLHKGGRIGGAAHFIGSLLNLKPQIWVDHESGKVGPGERTRTREKALESLYRNFFKKVDLLRPLHIAILHNAAQAEADALAEQVRQEYNPVEMITTIVSPVLGVHTGPAAVALCGYGEP
jgi:DegV family protein with EDD domain